MYERTVYGTGRIYDITSFCDAVDAASLNRAILDQLARGDSMTDMDIPSNSEIYLVLSNLISKIDDYNNAGRGGPQMHGAWLSQAKDLRDRMMSSDLDMEFPPEWVPKDTCLKCGGSIFWAVHSSKETFAMVPRSVKFLSTKAILYPRTLNVEFDNQRMRIGSGQTMRRWFKHDEICGSTLEETIEFLKPLWLATYKPVDKESSINNLKEILNDGM